MSVPLFMLKFTAKKVLGDLFSGADRAKNAVDYDKTRDLDKLSEKEVELEELPGNDFNKDDYQSRLDSLFIKGESTNLVEALEETSKMNIDLMSDVVNSVDSKMKVMGENLEKVKDVAETGSNLSNLNLQTSMNSAKAAEKGGIIEGVNNLLKKVGEGIVGTIGLIYKGVEAVKERLEIGVTEGDLPVAPGASEETINTMNKALETAQEDEKKKDEEVQSYLNSTDASPFVAVEYLGKVKATDWLNNYYETYNVSNDKRVGLDSEANAIREMSRLQQTNSGLFQAVDFNDKVISQMSDEELENYWNEYSFNDKQTYQDIDSIEDKWESKQKRDAKYTFLSATLADSESKLKFNSLLGDVYDYLSKYKYSDESYKALAKSLMKGKFPVFTKSEYKDSIRSFADNLKSKVVNDKDLMKIFSSEDIGLTKDDDSLKFLGNAMNYSSRGDYERTKESSVDIYGNYNPELSEFTEATRSLVRGESLVFDNKGNVVSDYGFWNDSQLSRSDVKNYEVLTDTSNPTFDVLGTQDIQFNANRENLQATIEQVLRNDKFGDNVDIMKIMDYIDSNDGKLDSYLSLMTEAVSGGFASVVSLVSNIVKESGADNVIVVPTDTD